MHVQTIEPQAHPPAKEILLTIQIPMRVWDMPDFVELQDFSNDFERSVNAWSDGRYPFSAEMFREGLGQELQTAIATSMSRFFAKKFGNEMVKNGDSTTAKWYLELQAFQPKPVVQLDTIGQTTMEEM